MTQNPENPTSHCECAERLVRLERIVGRLLCMHDLNFWSEESVTVAEIYNRHAAAQLAPSAPIPPRGGPKASPKQTPELWQAPVTSCPHGGGQALAFARERMTVADAKRERRPFHVQDGVQAVPTYEVAAVCFRAGGDSPSGILAEESAKFLRRDITDDFRTRRVRLDHALTVEDNVSAQREVRVLLQFTEGKSGDYVTWLSNLERKLKLKAGTKNS